MKLWRNARLATLADASGWGWIDKDALLVDGQTLRWVGALPDLPPALAARVTDEVELGGALLTPGLIDCHTHLVYGGNRSAENAQRLQGASYAAIAAAGGGIASTVTATRAASEEDLLSAAQQRLDTLVRGGVTALEIKSGYGLSLSDEAKCLSVARRLGVATGVTIQTTYLAAHALPPEFAGRADDYIDAVCAWLPALHAQGLVDAVDAFCEHMAFTPAQVERVFIAARALGLPLHLHAEQLSLQGGAALGARMGALSCDHLEYLDDAGVRAMAASGSVAVLLPGAFYYLRETRVPPVAALRAAGVPMAVATDHNPGSSPSLSLPLMLHQACTLFGLTPEEAWRGATRHAAQALDLAASHGALTVGRRADFVQWDLDHPQELAYWFGHNACRRVVVGGQERS